VAESKNEKANRLRKTDNAIVLHNTNLTPGQHKNSPKVGEGEDEGIVGRRL